MGRLGETRQVEGVETVQAARRNRETGVPKMPVDFTMPVANPRVLPHRAGTFAASGRPPHGMTLSTGFGVSAAPLRTWHDLRLR